MEKEVEQEFLYPNVALDLEFAPMRNQLILISTLAVIPDKDYGNLAESCLDESSLSIRHRYTGVCPAYKESQKNNERELSQSNVEKAQLQSKMDSHEGKEGDSVSWYKALYGMLLGGIIFVFAATWHLIQPGIPWIIGFFQSIVMIAPSLLIRYLHENSTNKVRFLRTVMITGLSSAGLTVIGTAVTKALAYHIAGMPISFLSVQTSSPLETAHLILSTIAFVSMVITEATLGGLLAILIGRKSDSKDDSEMSYKSMADKMAELIERINRLQSEAEVLGTRIAAIEGFDEYSKVWRKAQKDYLLMQHEVEQQRLRGKADAIHGLENLPAHVLMGLNGHKPDKGDYDD